MKEVIEMKLKKMARTSGSDRYTGVTTWGQSIDFYIPQRLSRPDSPIPRDELRITIEVD